MEIKVRIDGELKVVEIPFWQSFKVWILDYLAFVGMVFGAAMLLGIIGILL